MRYALAIAALSAMIPSMASAQISISEIMYDVEGTDADHEWIELYNSGSAPVDLTGWKINDGSNHVLNEPGKNGSIGSMTVAAGGYVILAADAATFIGMHPTVSNVLDTVLNLNNTGDTISLINAESVTVDSITYTKEIGGAGDGNSLHRSGGGSALTLGAPSPGTGTIPSAAVPASSSGGSGASGSDSGSSESGGAAQKSEPAPAAARFTVSAGADRTVIAGVEASFEASAVGSGAGGVGASFAWSFGDGGKGVEGARAVHQFVYPGRYVVVLTAGYQQETATDRIVVEALPAEIALLVFSDGGISIENKARLELDLSGWKLRDQGRMFIIPSNTIVLSRTSIRLAPQTLGFFAGSGMELLSPNEALLFHPGETKQEVSNPLPPPIDTVPDEKTEKLVPIARAQKVKPVGQPETPKAIPEQEPIKVGETHVAAAASFWGGGTLWWGGALAIAVLGGGAAFAFRRGKKNEWNIEDASEEV